MGFFTKLFGLKEPMPLRPAPVVITKEHIASVVDRMREYLRDYGGEQHLRLKFIKQASSQWKDGINPGEDLSIRFVIEGVTFDYNEMKAFGGLWSIDLNGTIVADSSIVIQKNSEQNPNS